MVFDSPSDLASDGTITTGTGEIFSMSISGDTSTLRQLTDDDGYDSMWARLSPDRTKILFHRHPPGGFGNEYELASLWVMDADGTDLRMIRPPTTSIGWTLMGHAEWSPDGTQIVIAGSEDAMAVVNLWLIDSTTGDLIRRLTHFGGPSGGRALDPSWSPDGTRIVYVGCMTGWCPWNEQDVFSVEVATGEITRHNDDDIADWDPFISPDGTQVMWNQQPVMFFPMPDGQWDIVVADFNPDGMVTNQRTVVGDGANNGTTEWSEDGESVFFHRHTFATGFRLYRMPVDGGPMVRLTVPDELVGFSPDLAAAGGLY